MTIPTFNFVIYCDDDLLSAYCKASDAIDDLAILQSSRGDISWCLRAYLILRQRKNVNVSCSNVFNKDSINIIHSDHLYKIKGSAGFFIVCVQADFPKRPWAHFHLVHNKDLLGPNKAFIPFWVQPKLVKRNEKRTGVKRVAYSGQIWNGNLAGNQKDWKHLFEAHGLEFVTISEGAWHDLSQVDVLIGIRSFNNRKYIRKPATKLVNAWHANIPFIGGNDSAYRQLGMPGQDYLVATSPKEALMAVLYLKDNPEMYDRLVRNGQRKASLINNETIALIWEQTLKGAVLQRYHKWQHNGVKESWRFELLLLLSRYEHQSKKMFKLLKKHSLRLIHNLTTLQPQ